MAININCDMGESFGLYTMGCDEEIISYIAEANIACGFHGSDPNHMRKTVELAKTHNVKVGAHFSLPDLPGFGRREMKIAREEMTNIIIYQIGALKGFLNIAGVELNHLKPHGALYGMAACQEHIAEAIADVGEYYKVPIFGLAGTLHEEVYTKRGLDFTSEFYADLEYDDEGGLIITREHRSLTPQDVADKCLRAITEGKTRSVNGKDINIRMESICIHSDTPNAVDVARAVYTAVKPYMNDQ